MFSIHSALTKCAAQMLRLFSFTLLLFVSLIISDCEVVRPNEVLNELDAVKAEMLLYQAKILNRLKTFNDLNVDVRNKYLTNMLGSIQGSVKFISSLDSDARALFATEAEGPCKTNLVNLVDLTVAIISNSMTSCIESGIDGSILVWSPGILDSLGKDLNNLLRIIIKTYIGRNIFTEGNQILIIVQELFEAKKIEFEAILGEIQRISEQLSISLDGRFESLVSCFAEVEEKARSGMADQISVCSNFEKTTTALLPTTTQPTTQSFDRKTTIVEIVIETSSAEQNTTLPSMGFLPELTPFE